MRYLSNKKLEQQFNNALENKNIIYLEAATGFGKTIFIRRMLKNKNYDYYSLKSNVVSIKTDKEIIVIDDFQYIIDKKDLINDINDLFDKNINVIIVSRAKATNYFMIPNSLNGYIEINEADLALPYNDYKDEFKALNIDDKVIDDIYRQAYGCGLMLSIVYDKIARGANFSKFLVAEAYSDYVEHIRNNVFRYIDTDTMKFLTKISVVDSFDFELATAISLSDKADSYLKKALQYGNFLFFDNGTYTIRPIMLQALRKYASDYYTLTEYNDFRYNAASYYELKNNIVDAAELYSKCSRFDMVKELLVINSSKSPEEGYYVELEKYYDLLTETDLFESPVLISGLAMLECIRLNVEKSTEYYNKLKQLLENATGDNKKLIKSQISYLDVALPQLGTDNIFSVLKKQVFSINSGNVKFQPYSITSNQPSIINGGKDFTPFARKYKENMKLYGHIVTFIIGSKNASGLLSTTEAEVMYEMGYGLKSLAMLTKAQMESSRDNYNIYFVGVRLETLLALQMGNLEKAGSTVHKFIEYAREAGCKKTLIDNAYALKTVFNIFTKNTEYVKEWLKFVPDERKKFYTLNRYQFLVKVLAYIYLKQYDDAILLLGKLEYYAEFYNRKYFMIQVKTLKAIIYYLTDNEYLTDLLEALELAQKLGLTSVISIMGSTVYEMIYTNKKRIDDMVTDPVWYETLLKELANMNSKYPEFLNEIDNIVPKLSETGLSVLRLQSNGLSINQIADKLGINMETVRYHAKQNYKKLGAQGKADAVIIAKKYKLI